MTNTETGRIGSGKVRMTAREGVDAAAKAAVNAAPHNPWNRGAAVDVRVEAITEWNPEVMCSWYGHTTHHLCQKNADFWVALGRDTRTAFPVCEFHVGGMIESVVRSERKLKDVGFES